MPNFDNLEKKIKKTKRNLTYIINNNLEAARFLTIFLIISLLFFVLYFLFQDSLEIILISTASITGFFSNLLGMTVSVNDSFLSIGTMDFEIIHECTGIFAILVTSSSVLAYPTQFKDKAIGILFIIPLILGMNLMRLLFIIFIGKNYPELFEIVHSYLWQGTFIIFIILAWFLWIEQVVHR